MKILLTKMKNNYPFRFIVFGLLLLIIPTLAEFDLIQNSSVRIVGYLLIYSIVALGLNLLLGFSGLISLGTAGFMGFGAYVFINVSEHIYDGFIVALLITLAISGLVGALIGVLSLRIEGIYLAIGTLFIGEIFIQIFNNVDSFTGGFSGMGMHYPEINLFFTTLEFDRTQTFYLIVIVLVIVMIMLYNLINSRTGRALMAMSRSEHAAQAMGISIIKYRFIAFITATVLAALGGVLYVSYFRRVDPSPWNLNLSLLLIAMVVVGGYKSIFGTIIGALIIYGVPELFLKEWFDALPGSSYIFSGILIIVVIMFYPHGLIYIGYDIKKLLSKIKHKIKRKKEVRTDE